MPIGRLISKFTEKKPAASITGGPRRREVASQQVLQKPARELRFGDEIRSLNAFAQRQARAEMGDDMLRHLETLAQRPELLYEFMMQVVDEPGGGRRSGPVYDFGDKLQRFIRQEFELSSASHRRAASALVPRIMGLLSNRNADVRYQAARYLAKLAPVAESALPSIKRQLDAESDLQTANYLKEAITEIGKHAKSRM